MIEGGYCTNVVFAFSRGVENDIRRNIEWSTFKCLKKDNTQKLTDHHKGVLGTIVPDENGVFFEAELSMLKQWNRAPG